MTTAALLAMPGAPGFAADTSTRCSELTFAASTSSCASVSGSADGSGAELHAHAHAHSGGRRGGDKARSKTEEGSAGGGSPGGRDTGSTVSALQLTCRMHPCGWHDIDTDHIDMDDVADFRPASPTAAMEPNGWAILGLPTDFYATDSGPQTVHGTLLGFPAQVRFTPVSYRWDYGDGDHKTVHETGGPWVEPLDDAPGAGHGDEFTPTVAGHTFADEHDGSHGKRTVTLHVTYTARYRFDGHPWRPVKGTLTLAAPSLHLTAYYEKTVLVAGSCLTRPDGPGC